MGSEMCIRDRPEDAAAGLLRRIAEGIRHRGTGRGLDPQRGPHRADAPGGTDVGGMGRRLRGQALARTIRRRPAIGLWDRKRDQDVKGLRRRAALDNLTSP